ncbi:MAG: hypothetical protein AAF617_00725 [Bacteroidota bacterium]
MSDQHNIDNFFRNRFKDFEPTPDPDIWNKISDKLDEQKTEEKKEGIVLLPWLYRAAGIAAAIILLFFVGTAVFDSSTSEIPSDEQTTSTTKENTSDKDDTQTTDADSQLTNTDNKFEQNTSQEESNTTSDQELLNTNQLANEDSVDTNKNSIQNTTQQTSTKGNALQNAVVQQNASNSNLENSNERNNASSNSSTSVAQQENAVTSANDQTKTTAVIRQENTVTSANDQKTTSDSNGKDILNSNQNKNSNDTFNKTTTNAVAQNINNSTNRQNATSVANNSATQTDANGNRKVVAIAQNDNKNDQNTTSVTNNSAAQTQANVDRKVTAIAQNDTNDRTNTTDTSLETLKDASTTITENKENAVVEVKKEETIKKSILDMINDLHELEENNTEVVKVPLSRWTISPNASPVYYNTLGDGSPIHSNFADNTKTGDINLSYGVNVGYDVSKRLTVRSGVHRVDFSYSTKDIAIVPAIDGPELTTINFRTNNVAFNIQDRQAPTNQTFSQYQLPTTESSIFQKQIEGDLNQRMSFIEVPVELKYAVVDKKIGINVIGGVSTMLLTENSIILDSPQLLTELGEATNINDVSFSTNIGFGIDYKFSEQLEFNLEPMLKYQLNTFSGNTGNFNPYTVGVYTGVSFRF